MKTNPPPTSDAQAATPLMLVGICLGLAAAVWAVFGQSTSFDFVNYDDDTYVYENSVVQSGLTWRGFLWALTYTGIGHWHPLTWWTHMADCRLYGLWAGGHHFTNVALHATAAVLLFLALYELTEALWRSAFVAAVFALHHLRAESVAWIAERKDVLSGVFFMLTLWAYARYARQPSRGRYLAVALAFALGLLCKNMLMTTPFVLLLLDGWPLGRMKPGNRPTPKTRWQDRTQQLWGLVKEKVPLFALSAGSCVLSAFSSEQRVADIGGLSFSHRAENALVSYIVYLRQMFFPAGLAVGYPFPRKGLPAAEVLASVLLLLAITAWVLARRKQKPFLLMGWLWYLGMLVPVIGFIPISYYAARADRYTYLPEIGIAIAVTWAVADWSARRPKRPLVLGSAMLVTISALGWLGHAQTSYWKDSETLWTRALRCTTDNAVAYTSLGNALLLQARTADAVPQFRKALELSPNSPVLHSVLAKALLQLGQADEATVEYQKALQLRPDALAHVNLGVAFYGSGHWDAAIDQYREALRLEPDKVEFVIDLGMALAAKGAYADAIAQYQRALQLKPGDNDAHFDLGNAYSKTGQLDEALTQYRLALEGWPNDTAARNRMGHVFLLQGQTNQAIESWQRSLAINPDQTNVLDNLAWLLATASDPALRDGAKAVSLAASASELSKGEDPSILRTLAAACAETGDFGRATRAAQSALTLAQKQKNEALVAAIKEDAEHYTVKQPLRNAPK